MKYTSLLLIVLCMAGSSAHSQTNQPLPLYPEGVPNSKPVPADYKEKVMQEDFVGQVTVPTLQPYFPEKGKATGTAVIICPGGGYAGLSMVKEGAEVAKRFAAIGVTAFVLKSRLPSDRIMVDKTIGPLQDAQRAIQIVRQRANEWGINTDKVGIAGFSAGGHLASTAGTHYEKAVIDNQEHTNLRPDFMVLLYPVITMGRYTHQGSKENLLGKNASQAAIDLYSNEKQVTANTPPTFLVQAEDDDVVPVQNAIMFYEAMVQAHVKGELHIYEKGGHGFGLHNPTTKDEWFDRCVNWLRNDILK